MAEVPEELGRKAVSRVVAGIVETQERAGVPIPGGDAVVDWARDVVARQVRIHEAQEHVKAVPAESPGRINRGEVGPNTQPVVGRDLEDSRRGRQHLLGDHRPVADLLLEGRLRLLETYPCHLECTEPDHTHEWCAKLLATEAEAMGIALRSNFADDVDQVLRLRGQLMMRVVEQSGQPPPIGLGLGDYREPRTRALVLLPPRGGRRALLPIEQVPRRAPVPGLICETT